MRLHHHAKHSLFARRGHHRSGTLNDVCCSYVIKNPARPLSLVEHLCRRSPRSGSGASSASSHGAIIPVLLLLVVYFICFIVRADTWLLYGLPGYLTNLFMKRMFGNNEYRFHLVKENELVCGLDVGRPPLCWNMWIHPSDLRTKHVKHKSAFVIYMLERKVGAEPLQRVCQVFFFFCKFYFPHAHLVGTLSARHPADGGWRDARNEHLDALRHHDGAEDHRRGGRQVL